VPLTVPPLVSFLHLSLYTDSALFLLSVKRLRVCALLSRWHPPARPCPAAPSQHAPLGRSMCVRTLVLGSRSPPFSFSLLTSADAGACAQGSRRQYSVRTMSAGWDPSSDAISSFRAGLGAGHHPRRDLVRARAHEYDRCALRPLASLSRSPHPLLRLRPARADPAARRRARRTGRTAYTGAVGSASPRCRSPSSSTTRTALRARTGTSDTRRRPS
jgi:hypothetical protein